MSNQPSRPEIWSKSRQIQRRIIVEGILTLHTPAGFGNGDAEGVTDMPLLTDPLQGRALLTGASIAGALRNYLWETERGFGVEGNEKNGADALSVALFGGLRRDLDGEQSALIVDDSLGVIPQTELRDGVAIDSESRTAKDKTKFDMQLLRVGSTFPLRFELLLEAPEERGKARKQNKSRTIAELRRGLALALSGLQQRGTIQLGMRKRRGFGECSVAQWHVTEYDLSQPHGLMAWLKGNGERQTGNDIVALLFPDQPAAQVVRASHDERHWFGLRASFWLDSSLLIRSGMGSVDSGPDAMHIHRQDVGETVRKPILPGTSLAGAIRHRALRIAQTIHGDEGRTLVEELFGAGDEAQKDKFTGSRIQVSESTIDPSTIRNLVQNRIAIDRFTGGVLDNFLFDEAPIFGGDERSVINIALKLRNPTEADIGLLLLVLKDLWTADLPLGGGASIGRGRLHGIQAVLIHHQAKVESSWTISQQWKNRQPGALLVTPDQKSLQEFVNALQCWKPDEKECQDAEK